MTTFRSKLIDVVAIVLLLSLTVLTIAFLLIAESNIYQRQPSRNTCEISEISPDVPVDIKEQCRKLRANANKN